MAQAQKETVVNDLPKDAFDINNRMHYKLRVMPLKDGQHAVYKLCEADMKDIARTDEKGKYLNNQPRLALLGHDTITDPHNGMRRVKIENIVSVNTVEMANGGQGHTANVKRVLFDRNSLITLGSDQNPTYFFMERHSRNRDNPFRDKSKKPLFYRVSAKKMAISAMENDYIMADAMPYIKNADLNEMKAIYEKLDTTDKMAVNVSSHETMKRDLFALARNFPLRVMRASNNLEVKAKIQIMDAEHFLIMSFFEGDDDGVERGWYFTGGDEMITPVEIAKNKYDGLVEFLLSGAEGKKAYDKMCLELAKVLKPKKLFQPLSEEV